MIICEGDRSTFPHVHKSVSGGSEGWKRLAYEPVKAWSTASWKAAEVVRRWYRGKVTLRPSSSSSVLVFKASFHRGWCVSEGWVVMVLLEVKPLGSADRKIR